MLSQKKDSGKYDISGLQSLVEKERKAKEGVLPYLAEIERRKLYLEYGCKDMIEFCVKEFSYSEDAAISRVKKARKLYGKSN